CQSWRTIYWALELLHSSQNVGVQKVHRLRECCRSIAGHYNNHVVLRDDKYPLVACARSSVDIRAVALRRAGAVYRQQPPEIAVIDGMGSKSARVAHPVSRRFLQPLVGNNLLISPSTIAEEEVANARHVCCPQIQAAAHMRQPFGQSLKPTRS